MINVSDILSRRFPVIFVFISLIAFITLCVRAYSVPFNHDETATFFLYVQSGKYMPFFSHVDANNHVLNSFLANICFHFFGSSPLSLRFPNLLGLLLLIFITYKLSFKLKFTTSKLFLTVGLLFSFHWLSFFGACRGYGMSMALLLAGILYLMNYLEKGSLKHLIIALIFFQFSISANLILIIVVLILSVATMFIQLLKRSIFKISIGVIWLIHFAAIFYWLSFSFFLQKNGALYYGEGESYWQVTFVSLIQLVIGSGSLVAQSLILLITVLALVLPFFALRKNLYQFKIIPWHNWGFLFALILVALIFSFYLMNKLMGVNYPEDRTGLFFYMFLILVIAFSVDEFATQPIRNAVLYTLSVFFVFHFAANLNFRKHSLNVYETIPEHFYSSLIIEQKKQMQRITIGGHRVRELFYAFLNYRNGSILNPADPVEEMQMNCDYYIAHKKDETTYQRYYDVIDTEPDWGFRLLKRKTEIQRTPCYTVRNLEIFKSSDEFIGLYERRDTTFSNLRPILAEVNFDVKDVPVPLNSWLVLQVNDSLDQIVYFKRFPLQWIGDNINGRKNLSYSLLTGNLPAKSKKIACFIWNIDRKPHTITVNSLVISQLQGDGVNVIAKKK